MERLTKRLPSGAPTYNYPASCYFDDDSGPDKIAQSAFRQRCVERLADYEDSACEPEEVLPKDKADEIALKLMRLADLESLCSYTRLRELAEADKDGRVTVLPCKVGDTVYLIVTKRARNYTPEFRFVKKSRLTFLNMERILQDFGKEAFLAREEAEKALEAMKDE